MRRCPKCIQKSNSNQRNQSKPSKTRKTIKNESVSLGHRIYGQSGMENEWNNILNASKQHQKLDISFSCDCAGKAFGNQSSLPKLLKMMADSVGNSINSFIIGDGECGYPANYLSSDEWCYVFSKCPNLINIVLESTYKANDNVFNSIIKYCPKVEKLTISGNDKISGSLTNKSIVKLITNANCLSNLRKLVVYDQYEIDFNCIKKLNNKRPLIKVTAGESDGYSMASMMVMAERGRGWNDGLYGNDDELDFLQNQNVPAPSDLFGHFGASFSDSDSDDDTVVFLRPDGDTEMKTISWCKCNGFFEVRPGYWSGTWYEKQKDQYKLDSNATTNAGYDLEEKIKSFEKKMAESFAQKRNKTLEKYLDFYTPLQLDYNPMTILTDSERICVAEMWKMEGNKMYSNKQYMEAIKHYQKATFLLDCTYFQNKIKNKNVTNIVSGELNDLLFIILSNTAQCWLSYAESVKNKQTERENYILYLLYALNNVQMSLWINNSVSNFKGLYRKIVCIYRLGLFEFGDMLMSQLKSLKNDKMIDLMVKKLQTETEKFNNNPQTKNTKLKIEKYSKLLQKLGVKSDLSQLMQIDKWKWNALTFQYLLLSVCELVRTQKWTTSNCMTWLKRFVQDIIDESVYYQLLPKNVYAEREYSQFRSYCFTFVMTVLSIAPAQIATYFDDYIGYKSEDEWEDLSAQFQYLQMKNKFMWFSEQFWSTIVENVLNAKRYDGDITEAIRKQTLMYVDIQNSDKRHLKWKIYHHQHEENKHMDNTNILPSDGRLNKLPKYNFEKGNSTESGQDDLLNIHALATSRKQVKVIEEIEHVMPHILYHMGFTWLHEFAKNGCYNACEFVVSMGMDVNGIDRVQYGGKRRYWYSQPVTAIDYVIKQLVDSNLYFAGTNESKEKLAITVRILLKLGGERYCDLKNKKADSQETKIFEKIVNGCNVNMYANDEFKDDESEDDDEEYGYGGIPQYMCDELLCQGIKPWDDDAMAALSVLYDFD